MKTDVDDSETRDRRGQGDIRASESGSNRSLAESSIDRQPDHPCDDATRCRDGDPEQYRRVELNHVPNMLASASNRLWTARASFSTM